MPRGTPQHLRDNPEHGTCWCGKVFTKRSDNQLHCSAWHRNLASSLRHHLPKIPPPVKQERKVRPPVAGPVPAPVTPTGV